MELLPIFKYPFDLKLLPRNGIYFFYEEGENSDHGDGILKPRIVRIGIHKENNFRTRISEHFLLNESRMRFTLINPKPSEVTENVDPAKPDHLKSASKEHL